jgi:DNA-directed RNA polymerase specialized sigma24 family protein
VSDLCTYSRDEIEQYMPGVWDTERVLNAPDPREPDPEMPKAQVDPRAGDLGIIGVADMKRAWKLAGLSLRQRQVFYLRFAWDDLIEDIAHTLEIDVSSVRTHLDRGMEKVEKFLNGEEKN